MKTPKWFDPNIPADFQHRVQADLAMYMINEIHKKIKMRPTRFGIVAAIDKATGYDKHIINKDKKVLKQWVKHFIKHAEPIGHDCTNFKNLLKELNK